MEKKNMTIGSTGPTACEPCRYEHRDNFKSAIGRWKNQQLDDKWDALMSLYPRYIEPVLKTALAVTPVVCLLGSRQTGKTTLVQKLKPKRAYINFDDLLSCSGVRHG